MPGSNWWVSAGGFEGLSGGTTVGGGGSTDIISPRSDMDARRMANQFAPGASYPDGYLGTITDRREDRLLGAVQSRLTDRSYQRGVHKGERLGADSYYWTRDCNPDAGITRESMAQLADVEGGIVMQVPRHVPQGNPTEKLTALGKRATFSVDQKTGMARQYGVDPGKSDLPLTQTDPGRAAEMMRMLPSYAR